MTRLNPLIVISDNEEAFAELYEAILSVRGFRCISIPDKSYLLDLIGAIRPDLVITDLESPGMDGLEFLERLWGRFEVRGVPVIVVSTHVEFSESALTLGVREFFVKPFEIDEFVDAVTSALVFSPWPEDSN